MVANIKPQQNNGSKHNFSTKKWKQTQIPNKTMEANIKPQQNNGSKHKFLTKQWKQT